MREDGNEGRGAREPSRASLAERFEWASNILEFVDGRMSVFGGERVVRS